MITQAQIDGFLAAYLGAYIRGANLAADADRISRVAWERGFVLSPALAAHIWIANSEAMSAGWLFLPERDDDLWKTVCATIMEAGG